MLFVISLVTLLLLISVSLNIGLYLKLKTKKNRQNSIELQEFLADLMGGGIGMIAVARVDPNSILMRTPRNAR